MSPDPEGIMRYIRFFKASITLLLNKIQSPAKFQKSSIKLNIILQNKKPRNVTIYYQLIYHNVPTTNLGPTKFFQPLAIAMAAAVVGPPIFALLATRISSKLYFNNFPAPRDMVILIRTIINTKTNSNGAFWTINGIDAGTPITTKKI